jgi:hypothetical protein
MHDAHTKFNLLKQRDNNMVNGHPSAGRGAERTNGRVPPAIHEIHARCLRQIERHTASLETDEEYSDMHVIHYKASAHTASTCIIYFSGLTEMLNSGVPSLGAHSTFEPANLKTAISRRPNTMRESIHRKTSTLQPKRDQVQKVDKLAKHDALCGCVLITQIAQFFDQGFYLGTRSPCVDVQTAKDALTRGGWHFQLQGRRFEIDREGKVTDRASRLRRAPSSSEWRLKNKTITR